MAVFSAAAAHAHAVQGFPGPDPFGGFQRQGVQSQSQGPEEVGVAAVRPVCVVADQPCLGVALLNGRNMGFEEVMIREDDFPGLHGAGKVGCQFFLGCVIKGDAADFVTVAPPPGVIHVFVAEACLVDGHQLDARGSGDFVKFLSRLSQEWSSW